MTKSKLYFLYFIILLSIVSLSVGYAAFISKLSISKVVTTVRVKKDVRITSVSLINDLSNSVSLEYLDYSVDSIVTNINFSNISSYAMLKVTISNFGNQEMGIYNINVPEGIGYEFSNYNLKDKICDSKNNCINGISKEIDIKIYPTNEAGLKLENIKIDFDLRPFNKITYTGMNVYDSYPKEVIDGGDISITFKENLRQITIVSNNVQIGYYSKIINGQTITFSNITNDVEINQKELVARLVNGRIDEVGGEVCIKDECFYVILNDGSTVTMLAKYNLHVGGEVTGDHVKKVYTAYGSEATGIQDESAKGYIVDNNHMEKLPFVGTTAFSNNNSIYSGSIVEEYVNNYNSYLITQGVTPIEARLITKDELIRLGCSADDYMCDAAPNWVYSTSYWSESAYDSKYVWIVTSDLYFEYSSYNDETNFGVRPVIELSVDDIYVPPIAKLVSGDLDTIGSEVCVKDECFYVISSTDDTVTMLAKYNLYVGNTVAANGSISAIQNPTGKQSEMAKGIHWDENVNPIFPWVGTTAFSNSSSAYSGSIVEGYVKDYKDYLITQGLTPIDTRLITNDELKTLGCFSGSCSGAPKFVYSTSYWTSTAFDSVNVFRLNSYSQNGHHRYSTNNYFGVRPVITISKSDF